jgi:hypothetical protein
MGVPVVKYEDVKGGITRSKLKDIFSFDADVYNKNRSGLLKVYRDILVKADITPSRRLDI